LIFNKTKKTFFLKFFQNELEGIFDKIHEKLIERIFNQPSNEILCYFYGNLINKLSTKSRFF
jgi:hypothetical protein